MEDNDEPILVNSPFDRLPVCGCDSGRGPKPTKAQIAACKLRRGPCSKSYAETASPQPLPEPPK